MTILHILFWLVLIVIGLAVSLIAGFYYVVRLAGKADERNEQYSDYY